MNLWVNYHCSLLSHADPSLSFSEFHNVSSIVICCSGTRSLLQATTISIVHHPLGVDRGIFTSDVNDGGGRDDNEHGDHHQEAGVDLPQRPLPSHGSSHQGFEDPWLAVTSLEFGSQGTFVSSAARSSGQDGYSPWTTPFSPKPSRPMNGTRPLEVKKPIACPCKLVTELRC